MQDSLEDYIKISKNKKDATPNVNPQLLIMAQKKRECETRALKIVEFLLEGKIRKEAFFECLKHINPSYYQDIVEERAITNLCGYCLCNKRIPEMPKKQYHISTKSNKVYDITDRKNYCSNICYKSSLHIKAQLETSPLWLRKPEDVPEFHLLPSGEKGLPGEEIDQGIVTPVKDETVFTSVSLFTEASLHEVIKNEIKKNGGRKRENKATMVAIAEGDEEQQVVVDKTDVSTATVDKTTAPLQQAIKTNVDKTNDSLLKTSIDEPPLISKKTRVTTKKTVSVDILAQIKKFVREWLTIETFIFIHGENKIKAILNETTLSDYFEKLKVADLQASQQLKYLNICKKLKLREIADEKFDKSVNEGKLRPVPDYKQLKEESKNLDLKVRAFYSGTVHEMEDRNFPAPEKSEEATNDRTVLPLIGTNAQNALRKKIYLDSVNRALQKLLPLLDLNERHILDDVQALVKTFNLQAHNTVFKPLVWTIVGIVLLEILAIKNGNVHSKLREKQAEERIRGLLKPFPNYENFVEDTIKILNDIDGFVERYVTVND